MALVVKDRVKETSLTQGTGTFTLGGAVSNFQSFSVIGDGNTTFYTITLDSAGEWEVGIGTYTSSGTTLSRDIVLESSNGGSLVSFSAGTKIVFCTYPAEKAVYEDAAGNVGIGTATPGSLLDVAADNTGLTGTTAGNTLRFTDTDTTTTSNQPIGKIEFYTSDISIGGTGVAAYVLSSTASTSGGGNLRFGTAQPGSSGSPTERMQITATGAIDMAVTSSLQKDGGDAYTLRNITYLTSGTAATYSTPSGVRALKVTVVGGGGGGGGVNGSTTANTNAYSDGGGGAGYATAFIPTAEASYTYTVGSGGTGGAVGNNAGAAGGTTEFKNAGSTIIVSAAGGGGGFGDTGASSTGSVTGTPGVGSITGLGTPGGVIGSGTGIYANGYGRTISGTLYSLAGSGYCPFIGGGVASSIAATGDDATNYGEGGGGVRTTTASGSDFAGGDGFQGIIIIEEYY